MKSNVYTLIYSQTESIVGIDSLILTMKFSTRTSKFFVCTFESRDGILTSETVIESDSFEEALAKFEEQESIYRELSKNQMSRITTYWFTHYKDIRTRQSTIYDIY